MKESWYYRNASQKEVGPLTWAQLVAAARKGELTPQDSVRKKGGEWEKADKISGLFRSNQSGGSAQVEATLQWNPVTGTDSSSGGSALDEDDSDEGNIFDESSAATPTPAQSGATRIVKGLSPGSFLGKYQIQEMLGEGGMGTVLKALHVKMDRLVALKVLRTQSTKPAGAIERFQQEVKAVSKLTHPNIVVAHDADEVNGVHFLVMEYVDGMDLDEVMAERGQLPVEEAVNYIIQTAEGLAYAHSEGVIHRDIKPSNLMIDKRKTVKILDMGLASVKATTANKARERSMHVTQADQILGTFDYLPPEQAEDARSADHRADIYSLGCTMYKLITGRPPYPGGTTIQKIFAHREHSIPTISKYRKEVSFDLDSVFGKMVAKDPDMRYQSMEEVIADLKACLNSKPISAWQTGGWSKADKFAPDELHHEQNVRIESGSDEDDDEYILSPLDSDSGKDEPSSQSGTSAIFKGLEKEKEYRWYWRVMGEEVGPLTLKQLRKQNINTLDDVRREDSDQWIVAQDVEGLFD